VNLREMKLRQKQECRQIEEYDRQSQARREALIGAFEREKQVLLRTYTHIQLLLSLQLALPVKNSRILLQQSLKV